METNQIKFFNVAQFTSDSSSQQQHENSPLVPIALTAGITLVITFVITLILFKLFPRKGQFIKAFQALRSREPIQEVDINQEFAVDIEVSNIRTLDNLRSNVQATIYVFIKDRHKAKEFLFGGRVSAVAVEKAVKKRAASVIRGEASKAETLNELYRNRSDIGDEAKKQLEKLEALGILGLKVRDIVIGEIDESSEYVANNYFDAQAIPYRTKIIQDATIKAREEEVTAGKKIQELELDAGKDMRIKELEISDSLERIEKRKIEIEKGKINHELELELYRHNKEKELQNELEIAELLQREIIETKELEIKKKIESFRNQVHQEIETAEIKATISIIQEEERRLKQEIERAKTEESLTTAIEEAKALREQLKAKIAADSVENEAKVIERLANADSMRYKLIPATHADRTVHLIREILPELPKFIEIAQALAPQAGILGDSNIYNFPNGNVEDINKLMLSASSMLFIQSLLDGKLGHSLFELVHSLRNDDRGKGEDSSEGESP
ncbi:hypothetical protein H6F88_00985 [Oculatella sp. FACHB-28]|uniref:SPFH domain-containing protein n=1 Tax=Oculatella sp. FACHB-28 TaxID=2692845 RepID=UPI00168284A1|nr:SPFH domain-containing protein [Oculatella sp. FACHB-28]MBD2054617.1 hypothetical protein [Oculatella sp. FACHB-28]